MESCDAVCLQDVRVLYNQMSGLNVDALVVPLQTSLDRILASIRSHWEKVIERNRAETDNYLEYKVLQTSKLEVLLIRQIHYNMIQTLKSW